MVPFQAFQPVTEPTEGDKNYLFDALIASIHSHPLQWHLVVTIGQPEDPTNDPTIPWPPDRQQVDAGTSTIDRIESDDHRRRDGGFARRLPYAPGNSSAAGHLNPDFDRHSVYKSDMHEAATFFPPLSRQERFLASSSEKLLYALIFATGVKSAEAIPNMSESG
jgi:hypothetical protein